MAMKSVISPEEGAELQQLYKDLEIAKQNTRKAILEMSKVPDGESKWLQADEAETTIIRRIKEIMGISGQHWIA